MDHLALSQGGFDLLFHLDQIAGTALQHITERAFAHRDRQDIPEHLTGPRQRQQLLLDQVDCYGRDPGTILDWRSHLSRKSGDGDLLAVGTLFLLALMFLHHHPTRRHLHHLSPLQPTHRNLPQVRLTVVTVFDRMNNHLIGTRREPQRTAPVAFLPSWLLAALLAQALGLTAEAIRRGRQVAIVAIFAHLLLQRFHLHSELAQLLLLPSHLPLQQRDLFLLLPDEFRLLTDRCLLHPGLLSQLSILLSQLDDFFCSHAFTLHLSTSLGKSLAHLGSYETKQLF
jgi:hypothetical protein